MTEMEMGNVVTHEVFMVSVINNQQYDAVVKGPKYKGLVGKYVVVSGKSFTKTIAISKLLFQLSITIIKCKNVLSPPVTRAAWSQIR